MYMYMYMYICMYVCMYVCMYIYIYIERERERDMYVYICVYTYMLSIIMPSEASSARSQHERASCEPLNNYTSNSHLNMFHPCTTCYATIV